MNRGRSGLRCRSASVELVCVAMCVCVCVWCRVCGMCDMSYPCYCILTQTNLLYIVALLPSPPSPVTSQHVSPHVSSHTCLPTLVSPHLSPHTCLPSTGPGSSLLTLEAQDVAFATVEAIERGEELVILPKAFSMVREMRLYYPTPCYSRGENGH